MSFQLFQDTHGDGDQWAIPPERPDDDYAEPCENYVKPSKRQMMLQDITPDDLDGNGMKTCGGKVKWISQHNYYNGQWNCCTVTVECEFCGVYDFEAV